MARDLGFANMALQFSGNATVFDVDVLPTLQITFKSVNFMALTDAHLLLMLLILNTCRYLNQRCQNIYVSQQNNCAKKSCSDRYTSLFFYAQNGVDKTKNEKKEPELKGFSGICYWTFVYSPNSFPQSIVFVTFPFIPLSSDRFPYLY